MVVSSLERHPTKDGYFIDDGFGEPIRKTNQTLHFEFQKFSCVDNYRIIRPFTHDDDRNEIYGEREEVNDRYVRIEMAPSNNSGYSYIGSQKLIKNFPLLIQDYNDHMYDHEYPFVRPFPKYNDYVQPSFGVYLYLEPSHKEKIMDDILNNKITSGSISFSFPSEADVLFVSDLDPQNIPNELLLNRQLDPTNYKYVSSYYPTKILPKNFADRGKTFLEPYDIDTPIREFDLTFGKTVINPHIDSGDGYSHDQQQIIEEHQLERMNAVFGENEDM